MRPHQQTRGISVSDSQPRGLRNRACSPPCLPLVADSRALPRKNRPSPGRRLADALLIALLGLLLSLPAAGVLQAKEQTAATRKATSKQSSVQKAARPQSTAEIAPKQKDAKKAGKSGTAKKAASKKRHAKRAAKPNPAGKAASKQNDVKGPETQEKLTARQGDGRSEQPSSLQARMKKYIGVPYRRGGSSTAGMDCSGFSKFIYSRVFGFDLPHKASSQFALPCMRRVSTAQLQTGDLLFFSSRRGLIDHVGIYLADGKFIHSARRKGVTISALEESYWQARLVGSKRMPGLGDANDDELLEARGNVEFFLGEKSSLRFQFAGLIEDRESYPFTTWGATDPSLYRELDRSIGDPLFSLKVGYSRHLWNDRMNVRLSALWGRSYTDDLTGGLAPRKIAWLWPSLVSSSPYRNTAYSSGLEIAGDIDLFQWLRLTPSAAYLGYDSAEPNTPTPRGILGLEASLGSPASNYALSMALRYSRPEDALYLWTRSRSSRDALDMAFAFRYHLTSIVQLSVVGQQSLYDNLLGSSGSIFGGEKGYRDLFFTLDYSY